MARPPRPEVRVYPDLAALSRSLAGKADRAAAPGSAARTLDGKVVWWVDEAATSQI
jgi:hypothetical protein